MSALSFNINVYNNRSNGSSCLALNSFQWVLQIELDVFNIKRENIERKKSTLIYTHIYKEKICFSLQSWQNEKCLSFHSSNLGVFSTHSVWQFPRYAWSAAINSSTRRFSFTSNTIEHGGISQCHRRSKVVIYFQHDTLAFIHIICI